MDRVNFYQLLELQINPPENDPQAIDDAIKKKQAEWSRLRNHPTKGIQARHYISLLSEIRNVMTDSELRHKEAQAAVEELKKRLESIFKAVDRHIDLIGSKGGISADEIERIAAYHEIKPQLVHKRVERWQRRRGAPAVIQVQHQLIDGKLSDQDLEKIAQQNAIEPALAKKIHQQLMDQRLAELDEFINIQIRKGYMTQAEITGLAMIFPYDEGEILRRIRCPIKKSAKKNEAEAYQLDSTVEQVISENLKIVGHDSLYSFLGLFPGTSLEALQNKAVAKENEIRKIAQKDAILTASGVLAGQCITLFKSDESRYAYDLSRARLLLKKLNTDIDLAVTDKTLPREQYDYLVRQAIRFGTLPEEAQKHIRDHCQSKGWTIVRPKKKKNLKKPLLAAAILLLVVGLGGGAYWYFNYSQAQIETAYLNMRSSAGQLKTLEDQIIHIRNYIKQQDNQTYIEKAQKDIEALKKRIELRDLKQLQEIKAELITSQDFEKAAALIDGFIADHPQSAHNQGLKQEREQFPALIDKRDYERIVALDPSRYAERAASMESYFRQHPKGAYTPNVNQIARQMAKPYYRQLINQLKACEKSKDWNQCIALSSPYIALYKDSKYAVRLRKKKDDYLRNLQAEDILTSLRRQAGGSNADPAVLEKTYQTYLDQHPYSPARAMIQTELENLTVALNRREIQTELQRIRRSLPKTKGRFREQTPTTILDKTTGLTWAMIDSRLATRECLTYQGAIDYVKQLKTGGFTNWRLPTAKELQTFYRGVNPVLSQSAEWYWTADKIKRYSSGWVTIVDVVVPATNPGVKKRNGSACGWVRAVKR